MYQQLIRRETTRKRREMRVRKHVRGSKDKPRFTVTKSNHHLYAQIIDDEAQVTLVGLGTMSKEFKNGPLNRKSKDSAKEIGKRLAERALGMQIQKVVFDRGRYKYHGLIAEMATAAREAGLIF